jgi:hypothetical protein
MVGAEMLFGDLQGFLRNQGCAVVLARLVQLPNFLVEAG